MSHIRALEPFNTSRAGQPTLDDITGASIVDAFRRHQHDYPNHVAIEAGDRRLRYAELGDRARIIATHLVSAGVTRGGVVAVNLTDPFDAVVAMLATVMAGGAYLYLDASLPAARITTIMQAARPQARVVNTVDGDVETPAVSIDVTEATPASLPKVQPSDLACVFFTSGSTGAPKGVALRHRGITGLLCGEPPLDLAPGQRMGQAAYLMFDAMTLEIWGPLLQGATVVCLPPASLLSPTSIRAAISEHRLDALFLTTALFHEIALRDPGAFDGLDLLGVGGEALAQQPASAVLGHNPPKRLRNLYGPTEATTLATWYELAQDAEQPNVPIGFPAPHARIYLLDENLAPVADGDEGELFIGGDAIGVGYLSQPGLTATRWLPDPFSPTAGERMYRTGDLARRDRRGALLYCGRRDRQLKLRGFRIEPAEIEAVLRLHPAVEDAAVELATEAAQQQNLVAHVVAANGPAHSGDLASELVAWVAARLPRHLVPAHVALLAHLPRTASGKLDRALLRAYRPAGNDTTANPASADDIEQSVAEVWAQTLSVARVDHTRNFFDVGGTSLLLMQVQAGLVERLGEAPSVRDLLAHPTVRAQAELIRNGPPNGAPLVVAATTNRSALARRRVAITDVRATIGDQSEAPRQ